MNVWKALGFMLMGGVLVFLADMRALKMYRDGKREATEIWKGRK